MSINQYSKEIDYYINTHESIQSGYPSAESMNTTPSVDDMNSIHLDIHSATSIDIENIQEEGNLIAYTENHFVTQVHQDLQKIRESTYFPNSLENNSFNDVDVVDDTADFDITFHNNYIRSNSPLTMSLNGSRNGSCSGSGSDSDSDNRHSHMRHFTYHDIEKLCNKYYNTINDNKYSSEIDILTTYIKGQKNLYIQSKYLTQRKLNCLMFPSLFLTAAITVIAPFIECQHWSPGLISGLNACIALFISMINYLKLESSVENYLHIANTYDKLETSLEMTSNKLGFLESNEEKKRLVLTKIREIEKKMNEIKESNTILIPEEIKLMFPVICNINIFSFIQRIQVQKQELMIKFKDVKNEIHYILCKWKKRGIVENTLVDTDSIHNMKTLENLKEKNRLEFLYKIKEQIKEELADYRNAYANIDELFIKEIKIAESKKNNWLWAKRKAIKYDGVNPVIDNFIKAMLVEE